MLESTPYVSPQDIQVIRRGYKFRFLWTNKVICDAEINHALTESEIETAVSEMCENLADDLNEYLSRGLPVRVHPPDYDPDFD